MPRLRSNLETPVGCTTISLEQFNMKACRVFESDIVSSSISGEVFKYCAAMDRGRYRLNLTHVIPGIILDAKRSIDWIDDALSFFSRRISIGGRH